MNLTQDTGPRHRKDRSQDHGVQTPHARPRAHWKANRPHICIVSRYLGVVNPLPVHLTLNPCLRSESDHVPAPLRLS